MKAKTIKRVLDKVHNDFINSITDNNVKELVRKNSIITGGSIVSMLLNEKVNDYDYYFTNKETVVAVTNYYVDQFNTLNPDTDVKPFVIVEDERVRIYIKSSGIASESSSNGSYAYFEQIPDPTVAESYVEQSMDALQSQSEDDGKPKYRPVFLSDNAITLSNDVQLVIRFYGEPEVIHKNYDFVHAMNYWMSDGGQLELPARSLESIITRELIYNGSKYPLASIIRARKFVQRKWSINAGQYLKMALQLNDLDLYNPEVLKEQLTGMDVAYFHELLEKMKKKMEEDKDFKPTSTYLIEIIDRIF